MAAVKESLITWTLEQGTVEASCAGLPPGEAPAEIDVVPDAGEPERFARTGTDRDREGGVVGWRYSSRESRRTLIVWND